MSVVDILGLLVTVIIICIVLYYARKRVSNVSDYLLGGRTLGGIISAFTWSASAASAGLFIGAAGTCYRFGWSAVFFQIGSLTGVFLTWLLIAPRLRRISAKMGALTTPEFISKRFGIDNSKLITSLWIIILAIPMMIVQFKGAALLFQTYLGIPYITALIIFVVIIALFTALGGYFAVAWLDTVQGIIMTVGMLIILPAGLIKVGGLTGLNNSLRAIDPNLVASQGAMPGWLYWGLMLVFFVSFWGQPHLAARFYTLKNDKAVRLAFPVTMILVTFWVIAGSGIGLIARVLFPELETSDLAMPMCIRALVPGLGIVVVLALLSAAMSTIDSLLLVVGSSFSHDIFAGFIKKDLSGKAELRISKITVAVVCIITFILSINPPDLITVLNAFAFGGFAIILGIPLLAGAFFKKANKYFVYITITAGPTIYILWRLFLSRSTGIPEMAATLVILIPILLIVNALTKKPDSSLIDKIF